MVPPDFAFEHMPAICVRMPNGALTSLAGNVDPHHKVAVADLILVQRRVRETVTGLVNELAPDLVGLSVTTFQRKTAKSIIELVRSLRPGARIVVGGYDPLFVIRNSLRMLAFNFRGSAVKSFLGLENEFRTFERYRAIRRAERVYI